MRQVKWEPLGVDRRPTLCRADDDFGGACLLCVRPRWCSAPAGATCSPCRTR